MGILKKGADLLANTNASLQGIYNRASKSNMGQGLKNGIESARNTKLARSVSSSVDKAGKNINESIAGKSSIDTIHKKFKGGVDFNGGAGSVTSGKGRSSTLDSIKQRHPDEDFTFNFNKNKVGVDGHRTKGWDDLTGKQQKGAKIAGGVVGGAAGVAATGYFAGKGMQASGMASADDVRPNY